MIEIYIKLPCVCVYRVYETTQKAVYAIYHLLSSLQPRKVRFRFQRSWTMELIYSVNLMIIISLNILFFISGACLNSLVIVTFSRSVLLQRKSCYFMIMVLSCCDLLAALTSHPLMILGTTLWLTEQFNAYPKWLYISLRSTAVFISFSLNALVVMSFDRYLATSNPIFHRTSVTKMKLSTLFAMLSFVSLILFSLSFDDLVISYELAILTGFFIYVPPMLVFNYKLFMVGRKIRRLNNEKAPEEKKTSFSLKMISSCVLAVVCCVVLFTPALAYIGLKTFSKEKELNLNNSNLTGLWTITISSMNSTFNCLIFYWKNKILRTEGMKVIKSIKVCKIVQPESDEHENERISTSWENTTKL